MKDRFELTTQKFGYPSRFQFKINKEMLTKLNSIVHDWKNDEVMTFDPGVDQINASFCRFLAGRFTLMLWYLGR